MAMTIMEIRQRAHEIGVEIKAMLEQFESETDCIVSQVAVCRDKDGVKQVLLDVKLS